jgi:serine/threonine-protein kinase
LKPANVKVRPDGTVKVLDFGLAKAISPVAAMSPAGSLSPTITTPAMTQMGVILGTAAYMSPEQAKGREADKRSDVWAFGAVFYEMLTARRAFEGEDMSDTLASVLKSEPDWSHLPPDVPSPIRLLIQRCLTKDRRQRVANISAAKFVLNELAHGGEARAQERGPAPVADTRRRILIAVLAASVATAMVVGAAAWALRPSPPAPVVTQFEFGLPEGQSFTGTSRQLVALSPDGTKVAYLADGHVYLRSIGELEPRAIPGIDTDPTMLSPVFAPDGDSIAFFTQAQNLLKRIPVSGGTASTVGALKGTPLGISWSADSILVGQGTAGIVRLPAAGGAPEQVVSVAADEWAHGPQILPNGRILLFTLAKGSDETRWDKAKIVAHSLTDGTTRVLIEGGSDARYLPTGHLVYAMGGTLFAVPFDAESLMITGTAVPVIVGVRRSTGFVTGAAQVGISTNGTLAYLPGPASPPTTRSLLIGDGSSDPVALRVPPGQYVHPRAAPDGKTIAVGRNDGQQSDIWTYDLSGSTEIRRLTLGGNNRFPVWFSDSRRVTFQSAREGDRGIFWQNADGSGTAERLTTAAADEEHVPESWSRDGTHMLFAVVKGASRTLWVFTLDGRKTEPFGRLESRASFSATFSPDGRWVAYAFSDRTGSLTSPDRGVFVEPFPPTGEKHQVPKVGVDFHPVWAPDGTRIFVVPAAAQPTASVPIVTRPSIAFGTAAVLPRLPRPGLVLTDLRGYDVLSDGRVISSTAGSDLMNAVPRPEVRVVLNWFEELKRLAPSK